MSEELIPFEDYARENGTRHWASLDFMKMLGYKSASSFSQAVNKAMTACATLGITITDAFVPAEFEQDGKTIPGYKLSRFACFLVAMHADDKKKEVLTARVYLAAFASSIIDEQKSLSDLVRIELRNELKQGEKNLAGVVTGAGLSSQMMGLFKDAGFRGMYNMGLRDLKMLKGIGKKDVLYDFMGQTELAGNFFRVTQTAERIKSQGAQGSENLNRTANRVGRDVRDMMIKNGGIAPENLPATEHVKEAEKRLKGANREMKKLDKPKAAKKERTSDKESGNL